MADQEEVQAKREAVQKVLFKNSIFFNVGWLVLIIGGAGIGNVLPVGHKLPIFLMFLGWGLIGLPKIWIMIKGGGLGGAMSPSYEVVTTYSDGSRTSDGGLESATTNIFVKLIQIGLVYVIGGVVQIIHQIVLTIRYMVLHGKAKPKPAFITSGLFIIVLNVAVFIGACVVAATITTANKVSLDAAAGRKTSNDYRYRLNEAKDGIILEQYLGKNGGDIVIPATFDGLPVVGLDSQILFEEYGTKDWSANDKRQERITSVVIPDTVTFINSGFKYCKELKQITLPKNLKSISGGAFQETGLTSITIPEGVTDIGGQAFWKCENLSSVTFPRSLERVGQYAFADCGSLVNVSIPSGHTIMYGSFDSSGNFQNDRDTKTAFVGCTSLSAASKQAIKDSGYTGGFVRE